MTGVKQPQEKSGFVLATWKYERLGQLSDLIQFGVIP
jgi:hypothetical protein